MRKGEEGVRGKGKAREGRRNVFEAPHTEGGKRKRARKREKNEEVAEEGKREVGRLGD